MVKVCVGLPATIHFNWPFQLPMKDLGKAASSTGNEGELKILPY